MKARIAVFLASAGFFVMPANAFISGVGGVDLSAGAYTFAPVAGTSFTFAFAPRFQFDFDPVTVQTSGTGETTAFGGFLGIPLQPSTFFTRANVEIGPNTFPGFAPFPDATRIPGSIVASDLGLRYTVGNDVFYGYARIANAELVQLRFQTTANTPIIAGTVPEPESWALMLLGFGAVGTAIRRRPVRVRFA